MNNDIENIKNCFTENQNGMDLEINHLTTGCISSKENNFNLDEEGNLTVKTVTATEQDLGSAIVNFPLMVARPTARYTANISTSYTDTLINLGTIVNQNNQDGYFRLENNGIRVLQSGWYLASASASVSVASRQFQIECSVNVNGVRAGQTAHSTSTEGGINQSVYAAQPIYINGGSLVRPAFNYVTTGVTFTVYESSILSLIKII